MHWDSPTESCAMNICSCGNQRGATGSDCPKDGAEKCLMSQRATCKGKMVCPKGYVMRADSDLHRCASSVCSQTRDLHTCCGSPACSCQKVSFSNPERRLYVCTNGR